MRKIGILRRANDLWRGRFDSQLLVAAFFFEASG